MAQQAQAIRAEQQTVSSALSLSTVKTLLQAGLGCITYMRDLLPQDNFTESHLMSSNDSISYHSTDGTPVDPKKSNQVNTFKIMTMTRGYTEEADRILNYLEDGIFDALQKQYLRSFIFGIYLDSKDPNNIVEAYNFNFQYYTIPGTDTTIPLVTMGEDQNTFNDPVVQSMCKGKPPTVKDVKRSVKTLLKTLIASMTQMDSLPKRRFASFKVFYTDDTPPEYEPPNFAAGDFEKDKWYFTTHDLDEVPDKWNVGKLNTGHHSVDVNITSIATYLPSSTAHDDCTFAGTTIGGVSSPTLTPAQEAEVRAVQVAKQGQDASSRTIVWAVEGDDADAEGDDDPEYVLQPDGSYVKIVTNIQEPRQVPIGMRNEDGDIEPISASMKATQLADEDEFHFSGQIMRPNPLLDVELAQRAPQNKTYLEPTQSVVIDDSQDEMDDIQTTPRPRKDLRTSSTAIELSPALSAMSAIEDDEYNLETTMLQSLMISNRQTQPEEILSNVNMDTGPEEILNTDDTQMVDVIESFSDEAIVVDPPMVDDAMQEDPITPVPVKRRKMQPVDCECGIEVEDESCFCEGPCARWYHVWCMGYHAYSDARMPAKFICFDCRVKADISWELIKVELYPKMSSKFKELALFRRAIKVAERDGPGTPQEFAKKLGSELPLARQIFKRLEAEDFIMEVTTTVDEIGIMQTRSRAKPKVKGKQQGKPPGKVQKNRKPVYVFNRASRSTKEYLDYFNPAHEVEAQKLDLPQLKQRPVTPIARSPSPVGSPTQADESMFQFPPPPAQAKRTAAESPPSPAARPKKKVKISVAAGVDLAE
ncbi:HORMA domain-containing protein [Mycena floridula]|nr:HORMA domain-containing protein [Mycena floridula]